MFKNNFDSFYGLIHFFFRVFLISIVLFVIFRFAFLFVYGNKTDLTGQMGDLIQAFLTGLRFDTSVTAYGMLLPFMAIVSTLFVPHTYTYYQISVRKFILYYSMLLFLLFLSLSLIDYYFYKFFQFHINILFFGIVNDDTLAVIKSVWTDYPVIGIFVFVAISMLAYWYIIKRLYDKQYYNSIKNPVIKTFLVIAILVFYGIGMRGSLGTFVLENEDSIVSENPFINTLTINGVFSFKIALTDKRKQQIDTDIQKTLSKYGFNSREEVFKIYSGGDIQSDENIETQLIAYTGKNNFIQDNPPNVVFIQMESFGNYYLDFHSASLNLLGRLEGQLKDCILFRNFLSGTTGTIHTLEGLMLGSPLTPISQSTYMDCSLTSSVALPFKDAGYHTSFVTSADLGWRNLDKFVNLQYFETVEGAESLLRKVSNSSRGDWGVFDEFLFSRMFDILQEPGDKPQFIFAMTTTNHTPFELPAEYKPYPVALPENIRKILRASEDIAIRNFTNYQYANDCLGGFIEMVRNSPIGENTIIAATGDHSSLQLFNFAGNQTLQKLSVPFLVYVPQKYMPANRIDTSRFASHRDIFPTLFNSSLSDAAYLNTGVNLFDSDVEGNDLAIINYDLAMNRAGCVDFKFEPLFFKWSSADRKLLQATTLHENPILGDLLMKAKAYGAAMSMYIQNDLAKCKNSK